MKNTSKYLGNELKYLKLVLNKKLPKNANSWRQSFEEKFAKKYKKKFAISFNSGTSTLHAALIACGVKPGDEVIVPSITFVASATLMVGAKCVPAVMTDLYKLSTFNPISVVEPEVTFKIFSTVCSLSPGLILSGE